MMSDLPLDLLADAFRARKTRQRREADEFLADPAVSTPRPEQVSLLAVPAGSKTTLAQPGQIFYDAAGFVSIDCVRRAAQVGDHISLYMGGRYGCTRAHVEAAWAEGAGVIPNWERNADQALKGYTDGRNAVYSAMATAVQWGLDTMAVPVIFSGVDFGPTGPQFTACDLWHRGIVDSGGEVGLWPGFYGYTAYGDHLTTLDFWVDENPNWQWAGSGSVRSWCDVKQKYGSFTRDVSRIGCTVDENVVVKPLTVWTGDGPDEPKEKDEMTEAEWERMAGLIEQKSFDAALSLWRSPEIHQIIHDSVPSGTSTADAVAAMKQVMRDTSLTIDFQTP